MFETIRPVDSKNVKLPHVGGDLQARVDALAAQLAALPPEARRQRLRFIKRQSAVIYGMLQGQRLER